MTLILSGLTAAILLRLSAEALLLFLSAGGRTGPLGTAVLLFDPLALSAAALGLLALQTSKFGRMSALKRGALALAAAVLSFLDVRQPWGGIRLLAAAAAAPALAAPFVLAALARRSRRAPPRAVVMTAWAFIIGACVMAAVPAHIATRVNELGLISAVPDSVQILDYRGQRNKDHYPVCRFRYNHLGYRDEPPAFGPKRGRRRVLIVGDSYIWGDGIPTNEETLPGRLRAELNRTAPGRYEVMSAAYPGLGLYGYSRFVDALAAQASPDVVIVGYLGFSDHDPLDPQALMDGLSSAGPLRNFLLNFKAAQWLHEASVLRAAAFWRSAQSDAYFRALYAHFAHKAEARGYRLLFLTYTPPSQGFSLPSPIETVDLSDGLRCPGYADENWYGKDFHPKPKLNSALAKILSARIIGPAKKKK